MGRESKSNKNEQEIKNLQLSGTRILSLSPADTNTLGCRENAGGQLLSHTIPLSSGLGRNNRSYDRMKNLSPSTSNKLVLNRSQRSAIGPSLRKSSDPLVLAGVAGKAQPQSKTALNKDGTKVHMQVGREVKEVCG